MESVYETFKRKTVELNAPMITSESHSTVQHLHSPPPVCRYPAPAPAPALSHKPSTLDISKLATETSLPRMSALCKAVVSQSAVTPRVESGI